MMTHISFIIISIMIISFSRVKQFLIPAMMKQLGAGGGGKLLPIHSLK